MLHVKVGLDSASKRCRGNGNIGTVCTSFSKMLKTSIELNSRLVTVCIYMYVYCSYFSALDDALSLCKLSFCIFW